ncbi:MAG: VOC family protein [Xanthobacteraceae bacterium]|nr:VOC family protein [Xanthobacteraceae bacterium]
MDQGARGFGKGWGYRRQHLQPDPDADLVLGGEVIARGLDHIVHAVHDLDAAAEFYRRAGFQVGARNTHPWGTQNHVVQLRDFYIEILGVADASLIPPHGPLAFSFGAFHRDFLARRQGLAMLLLKSHDACADARAFHDAGIGDYDVFDFERQSTGPDGKPVKLAFSLAFARDEKSPHTGFGTCQHHYPQNFWSAARQVHDNGAQRVGAAIMVADNPTDHHIFLSAFTGVRMVRSSSLGIASVTPNGEAEIMEATGFHDQFGVAPKIEGESATFNGLRLVVKDVAATERLLKQNNIACHRHVGRVIVPPDVGFGATLIFDDQIEG